MKKFILLAILPALFAFTYPVDTSRQYAAIDVRDMAVMKVGKWPRADGMEIVGLDPLIQPVMVTEGAKPVYDELTQKLESNWVIDLPAEEYRREWTVVDLTQNEIDEITESDELDAEMEQARAAYIGLKNGVGTNAQRLVRVEQVLAHLIRKMYKP